MELLDPRGLWLLGAMAPLIALYILKIRRERRRVSSTWLWAAAQRDLMARHPFKKLTAEIPLLLELLALAALALALARPASRGGTIAGDHVAIVIDVSASMAAASHRDGSSTTRIAEAKDAARSIVLSLAPGADAFVVEAGRDARVLTPVERDRQRLRASIDAIDARAVEGDLAPAVALAADRLRALGGAGRVVVVTDGALARESALTAAGVATQVVTVGDLEENAAIVRVDVRTGVDAATKHEQAQVFAMIASSSAREAYVTATIEGRADPVASRRVMLEANGKTPVVLSFEPKREDEGAGLVIQIAPSDALALDDVAFARVPPSRKLPVVVASDGSYSWTARALEADGDASVQRVKIAELATVNIDPDALVVVEGACPASLPGRDLVVVSPPDGECLGVRVGASIAQPQLTSWDASDPRLRFLTLDGVHVARAHALGGDGSGAALVRATTTTLIADASTPGRAATVLGFDPGESDWPLQASFVLFVRNVVELARLHRTQGAAAPSKTGDPLRVAVPAGVEHLRVTRPGHPDEDLDATDGFALVASTDAPGLYRVRWLAPHVGSVLAAVNLTSDRESDLRAKSIAIASNGDAPAVSAHVADAHHEWRAWLALFAALLLALDVAWLTHGAPASALARRTKIALMLVATLGALPLAYEALVESGVLHARYVRFDTPRALFAVSIAGLVLAWRFAKLPSRMGGSRRAFVTTLSTIAVFAAALAVAEPELGAPLDRLTAIVAIDRSRSIDLVPGAESRVHAELEVAGRSMHGGDRIGTIVFGAEAATEDPPRPKSELAPPQRVEVGRDATDLEAAIRRSLAELPPDTAGRVILVTDGVETRGDALSAAAAAIAAGVPVDSVILEQKPVADVRIASVRAPSRADEGEPIDLRVVTSSTRAADIELRISRDGEVVRTARAHIEAGEDVLRVREIATGAGLHRYDVAVTAADPAADASPDDNTGSAFIRVRGAALALVLEGDDGKSAPLAKALLTSGFRVDVRSTSGVPDDIGGLAGYDLVVLADIPARDLATQQVDALASYARDLGGGLLLMGGDRAMGPGGYARTPIEEVSPVSFDLKEQRRRASLAEVIAIDYSGSMGMMVAGQTKLALANEAAARSASLLGPGDRLGVEHVDTVVSWTIPIGPVTDANVIGTRIRSVDVGGGGIYTDVALRAAYLELSKESVNLKHVLLFADGNDAEQIAGCRVIVHDAETRGITTSVISLGSGHDTPELEVLSKMGGGRFYLIEDATKLPAVFTQETILAAKSSIHEEPFGAGLAAPSPATRAIDFASAPALHGYVTTMPKPRSTVSLVAQEGDPLLATWSVGVGHAGAFTSDYHDKWGAAWLAWPGASKMFGQLARDLARKPDDSRVRLESDAAGGELHVRADVVGDDGRAQTFRRLTAHVAGPDGFSRDVALEAVGAGRYSASLPLARAGTYVAVAKDELSGDALGTTGAVLSGGEELRPTGSDRALLGRISRTTGGKTRDTLAGLFDDRAALRFAYTPLAPALAWIAGFAMLFAVAARRLGVPDALGFIGAYAVKRRAKRARAEEIATRERASRTIAIDPLLAKKRAAPHHFTPVAPPAPPTTSAPPPTSHTPNAPSSPTDPSPRALTAAERLAQKRRTRR